jgi:GH18 family chitinase
MHRTGFFSLVLLLAIVLSSCGTATPITAIAPTVTLTPPGPAAPVSLPAGLDPGKRVIGYYAQWAAAKQDYFVSNIPANLLTHINYAFSNVSPLGMCILGDQAADVERFFPAYQSVTGKADVESATALHGNFNQLLELKAEYPHLKILISIGGWSWSENFSNAALTDSSRKLFVSSCIDLYLKQYKGVFDGIDIDWEYPVSGGLTNNGRREDKHNFTLLLAEFRRQLDELGAANGTHYLLTIAGASGPGVDQHYERPEIAQYLDWINLMTYDLHGTWDLTTNFNAPLYQANDDPGDSSLNVDAVIQDYLGTGILADQLVMGVPFYGHIWKSVGSTNDGLYQTSQGAAMGKYEPGSVYYNEIVTDYLPTYKRSWEAESQVPWLYNINTARFVSYDDPQSIAAKAGYAKDQNLSGIMIWELSQGNVDMVEAIQKGFQTGGIPHTAPTRDPNAVIIPRPFSAEIHSVSSIKIDGNLDDWTGDPTFTLNDKSQLAYKLSTGSWTGPEDLSGQVWTGWAPDGLYFAVKVVDDVHIQTVADLNIWHGDYVEFQFDTQLEKDRDRKSMNSDDYQIGVSVGDFASVPPFAYAWFNGPDPAGVINIQQAQTQTPDGYILEVFFPIDVLKGITLTQGAIFGMNVSLSDSDSASSGQEAMLSTSSTRTYADPTTFGAITLK